MKRIFGLIGMILGFVSTVVIGALLLGKGSGSPAVYAILAGGAACVFFSFKLFRSGKPLGSSEAQLVDDRATVEFIKTLPTHHYFVSGAFSAVLVLVYAVLVATKNISFTPTILELYNVGGGFGEDAAHGQVWRLFTQIFLHGSVGHLFSNIIGLIAAGRLLDYLAGRKNVVGIFLVGGLAASVASSLLHPTIVSIGASGAVFALYGAIFSSYFFNPKTKNLQVPKGIWLASGAQAFTSIAEGFKQVGIDNAAHVGGLVAGFVLMSIAYQFRSENKSRIHTVFGGAVAAVAAFSLTVMPGFIKQNHSNPVTMAEKSKSIVAAIGAVEDAENELAKEWKGLTAENRAEKIKWSEKEFLPKFQKLIADLKELTEAGLPERLISLKKSVQDSASACRDLYGHAIKMERSPASEDSIKMANLKETCVEKMKERNSLVDQINGAGK